jgi:hypothetical protein
MFTNHPIVPEYGVLDEFAWFFRMKRVKKVRYNKTVRADDLEELRVEVKSLLKY